MLKQIQTADLIFRGDSAPHRHSNYLEQNKRRGQDPNERRSDADQLRRQLRRQVVFRAGEEILMKNAAAIVPNAPQTPWTEMAPTGSSTRMRSKNRTE
jgi:hypothetical protein